MKPRIRRISTVTAVAGVVVALISTPLAAQAATSDLAPVEGAAYEAAAQTLLADLAVQGVGVGADGDVVIYATKGEKLSTHTQAFVDDLDNVTLTTLEGTFEGVGATDIIGGAGYAYPTSASTVGLCSIGFSAFAPDGKPAFISAGHCTGDGAAKTVYRTKPSLDAAGGGVELQDKIATLGFTQFGGPGNSTGTNGSRAAVDVSAYRISNPALVTLPAVTNWSNPSSNDLSRSFENISSVGSATIGAVERSGRTSGKTSGRVLQTNAWFRVTTPDSPQGRFVFGFVTNAHAAGGDSGGPIWQGSKAVGIVSAVGTTTTGVKIMLGADLKAGLARTGGYTVKIKMSTPAFSTSSTITAGATISGRAPAGSKVDVRVSNGQRFTATSAASGAWKFTAPKTAGTYTYAIVAKNGFNSSATAKRTYKVLPAKPAISSPRNGSSSSTTVMNITGTGTPGARVTLGGEIKASHARSNAGLRVTVSSRGTWSVPVKMTKGTYRVTARQTQGGLTSATVATRFSVTR